MNLNVVVTLTCARCGKVKALENLQHYGFYAQITDKSPIKVTVSHDQLLPYVRVDTTFNLQDIIKLAKAHNWFYDIDQQQFFCEDCKKPTEQSYTYVCSHCKAELHYAQTLEGEGFIDFTGWYAYNGGAQYLCPACYRSMFNNKLEALSAFYDMDDTVMQFLSNRPYLVLLGVMDDIYKQAKRVCGDLLIGKLKAHVYFEPNSHEFEDCLQLEIHTNTTAKHAFELDDELLNYFILYDDSVRSNISFAVIGDQIDAE